MNESRCNTPLILLSGNVWCINLNLTDGPRITAHVIFPLPPKNAEDVKVIFYPYHCNTTVQFML